MDTNSNTTEKKLITGETLIADMVLDHPFVVDYLIEEYGFHCVSCFISSFEQLRDGAAVHGISGDDFEEMLTNINNLEAEPS